jgi:hypothetical protein
VLDMERSSLRWCGKSRKAQSTPRTGDCEKYGRFGRR